MQLILQDSTFLFWLESQSFISEYADKPGNSKCHAEMQSQWKLNEMLEHPICSYTGIQQNKSALSAVKYNSLSSVYQEK